MERRLRVDKFGWPLVSLPNTNSWVYFFPLTKIQFEYFLCSDGANRRYNKSWYEERLQLAPRVTAAAVSAANFDSLFMADLAPEDVIAFADWLSKESRSLGAECTARLMTATEWENFSAWADSQSSQDIEAEGWEQLGLRAKDVFRSLQVVKDHREQTLAAQMWMRGCLYEIVSVDGTRFAVRGSYKRKLMNSPQSILGLQDRSHVFGTRLLLEFV
jgi:hypothetical protein